MEYEIQNFVDLLWELLQNFYHSPVVLILKILLGIYLAILVVDILLLLILHDTGSDLRVGLKGMDLPLAPKGKMRKRWDAIAERLKSENVSQYKVAIIEADALVEEILAGIGYKGANMSEKLEQVDHNHLDEHAEALKDAHGVRNRIVHEADFVVDQRMATALIGVYASFLKYLEFLD